MVAGDNDLATQRIASAINRSPWVLLGTTLVVRCTKSPACNQGDDKLLLLQLVSGHAGGPCKVGALIVDGINPAYHAAGCEQRSSAGLEKVGFSVSTAIVCR